MARGWAAVGPAAEEHLAQPLRDMADVTWCHLSLSASSKPQNGFLPIPTPPFSSSAAHGIKSHLIYSVVGGSWCWWEQSPSITPSGSRPCLGLPSFPALTSPAVTSDFHPLGQQADIFLTVSVLSRLGSLPSALHLPLFFIFSSTDRVVPFPPPSSSHPLKEAKENAASSRHIDVPTSRSTRWDDGALPGGGTACPCTLPPPSPPPDPWEEEGNGEGSSSLLSQV